MTTNVSVSAMLAALAQPALLQARTVQTPAAETAWASVKVNEPAPDSGCTSWKVGLNEPGANQCVRYSPAPVPVTVTTARAHTASPEPIGPGAPEQDALRIVRVAADGADAATDAGATSVATSRATNGMTRERAARVIE